HDELRELDVPGRDPPVRVRDEEGRELMLADPSYVRPDAVVVELVDLVVRRRAPGAEPAVVGAAPVRLQDRGRVPPFGEHAGGERRRDLVEILDALRLRGGDQFTVTPEAQARHGVE